MAASEESKNILEDIRKRIDGIDYTTEVRNRRDENRAKRFKAAGIGDYGSFMKDAIAKRGGGQNTPSYEEFIADQPGRIADSIAATYAGIEEGKEGDRPAKREMDAIKLFETQYKGVEDPGAQTKSIKSAAGSFNNLLKFTGLDDDKNISEKNYNTLVERLGALGYKGPDISDMKKTEELIGVQNIDSQNDLRKLYDKYIKKNLDLEGRYETADSLANRAGYLADQDALAADQERFKDMFGRGGVIGKKEVKGMLNVEGQSPAQVRDFLDNYMNTYGGTVKSNAYDLVRNVSDDARQRLSLDEIAERYGRSALFGHADYQRATEKYGYSNKDVVDYLRANEDMLAKNNRIGKGGLMDELLAGRFDPSKVQPDTYNPDDKYITKTDDPKFVTGKIGIGKFMQDQIDRANAKDVYGRGPLSPGVLDGSIALPKPAPEFDLKNKGTISNPKPEPEYKGAYPGKPEFKGSAKISKSGWMELYPKGGDIGTGNRISPAEWMTLYPKGGDLYR